MDLCPGMGQPTFRVTQERSPYSNNNRGGVELEEGSQASRDEEEPDVDDLSETEELLDEDDEDVED